MSFLRSTFRGAIAKDWTFKNPALDILALPVDPFEPILIAITTSFIQHCLK